jgi:hypothetical protein
VVVEVPLEVQAAAVVQEAAQVADLAVDQDTVDNTNRKNKN